MPDDPPSERLGLRGTLDLISTAFRTAGTANATGAITAGASYRFFSDKPDLQWALKHITLVFLFGVLTFAISYIMLFIATVEIDHSLGRSSAQAEWVHIVWAPPQKPPQSTPSLLDVISYLPFSLDLYRSCLF